ncbi:MAG: hypothetical protein ACK5MU_04785 [Candidatus Saccharimonadales bacterium]
MSEKYKPSVDFGGHLVDATLLAKDLLPKTDENKDIHDFNINDLYIDKGETRESVSQRWRKVGRAVINAVLAGEFGRTAPDADGKIKFDELSRIKNERAKYDNHFEEPLLRTVNEASKKGPREIAEQRAVSERLVREAVDIGEMQTSKDKLKRHFPSGNWLYHGVLGDHTGSGSDKIIKICQSGALMNGKALQESDPNAVLHGGKEGISWSMNGVDAFPGDRYHAAGFLAAPEAILGKDEQLSVPSNPAVYEMQQLGSEVNMPKLWAAKKQRDIALGGSERAKPFKELERNEEEANLLSVIAHAAAANQGRTRGKTKVQNWTERHAGEDIATTLRTNPSGRRAYKINEKGVIEFDPNVKNHENADLPPYGIRYVQAMVDTGRLRGTEFEGKDTTEILGQLSDKNIGNFVRAFRNDVQYWVDEADAEHAKATPVKVPVENMVFVCAKSDLRKWARTFAACEHRPRQIATYDDQKVRISDWKQRYSDGAELTREIENAVGQNKNKVSYDYVIGAKFGDSMRSRARGKHGSIAEKYLKNTKTMLRYGRELVWVNYSDVKNTN